MGAADEERPTISTAEAASRLRVSPRRVLQLLDDPASALEGTPSAGHGNPRSIYLDSIERHEKTRLHGPGRSRTALVAAVHDLQHAVAELTTDLSHLTALVDGLRHHRPSTSSNGPPPENDDRGWLLAENEQLRFELAKSNAASDALRDAVDEQAAAADLYRQAADHEARVREALLRAEKARDDSRRSPSH